MGVEKFFTYLPNFFSHSLLPAGRIWNLRLTSLVQDVPKSLSTPQLTSLLYSHRRRGSELPGGQKVCTGHGTPSGRARCQARSDSAPVPSCSESSGKVLRCEAQLEAYPLGTGVRSLGWMISGALLVLTASNSL